MRAQPLLAPVQSLFAVDLDESLLRTDILLEKCVKLVRQFPLMIFCIPFQMLRGKLAFKKWIHEKVQLDYATLPVRKAVLEKIEQARARGERTLLISASLQEDVSKVGEVIPLFDELVGSSDVNLRGTKKLAYLEQNYSHLTLTYLGNAFSDLKIWKGAQKIIAINPSALLNWRISSMNRATEYIYDQNQLLVEIVRELRVYQWVKNFLVFLPVFAAHKFIDFHPWFKSIQAFLGFSFLASSVYVFNDICDLPSDRKQLSKKDRPLASGKVNLRTALLLVPFCLLLSFMTSWGLGQKTLVTMGCYLIMNVLYSFWVKKMLVLDVVFLAGFYTLRIFVGGTASDTLVSEWLLSFAVFFFFGLAMVKRFSELKLQSSSSIGRFAGGRAYEVQDQMTVLISGVSTSILSILILALYLSTGEVQHLYRNPRFLWLVTPCLLYWINRMWILGARGKVTEDPLVFALTDKVTWGVGLAVFFIVLWAI